MILPTKHISLTNSYLGSGMTVLQALSAPMSVNKLWKAVGFKANIANPRRFYFTLDLLYMLGAIELKDGKIQRT